MQAQPMQPVFSGGPKIPKPVNNFVRGVAPWALLALIGYIGWTIFVIPFGKKVSDGYFESGRTENFIIHPREWKTVPGKPWTGVSIKAANPAEEKYLFGRALQADGTWTRMTSLEVLMNSQINVGPSRQGYVEVGMGSSPNCPDRIRVLVIRNQIAH